MPWLVRHDGGAFETRRRMFETQPATLHPSPTLDAPPQPTDCLKKCTRIDSTCAKWGISPDGQERFRIMLLASLVLPLSGCMRLLGMVI